MKSWLRKRKLISLVDQLATYNDKGISWHRHDDEQVSIERSRLMALIKNQVEIIGKAHIAQELLLAIETGDLKTDMTGNFIKYAKQTKL